MIDYFYNSRETCILKSVPANTTEATSAMEDSQRSGSKADHIQGTMDLRSMESCRDRRKSREIGFRWPTHTPCEPRTTTEHWRTGASRTSLLPFVLFLSCYFSPRTRLHTSCLPSTLCSASRRLFLPYGLWCPVVEERVLIAAKYSGDCPTYGTASLGRPRQNWTRNDREGTADRHQEEEEEEKRNDVAVLWSLTRIETCVCRVVYSTQVMK